MSINNQPVDERTTKSKIFALSLSILIVSLVSFGISYSKHKKDLQTSDSANDKAKIWGKIWMWTIIGVLIAMAVIALIGLFLSYVYNARPWELFFFGGYILEAIIKIIIALGNAFFSQ